MTDLEVVFAYHESTKHHFHRFARSAGYMDWANQPDPFRSYAGARRFLLPFTPAASAITYEALYSLKGRAPAPVSVESLSELFECSLAISAWKRYQDASWALRCNPSSGNLHPTEGYLICGPVDRLSSAAAVWHYAPVDHALEQRAEIRKSDWNAIRSGFPKDTCFVGLSSIHWREAWKYGERAFRYCQHDVGHAIAAIALAASLLGWRCVPLSACSDRTIARTLGLDRANDFYPAEREEPELLLAIIPTPVHPGDSMPSALTANIDAGTWSWFGNANVLSADHVDWAAIRHVAIACERPETEPTPGTAAPPNAREIPKSGVRARSIILQRRSAVDMDGVTSIDSIRFMKMLERVMPSPGDPPWTAFSEESSIHLGLFVHRVHGMPPGLYCLVRNANAEQPLRQSMRGDFVWSAPVDRPAGFPLYLLREGDVKELAARVSCGQDIAGSSTFAVAMLATFESSMREHGAWFYRRLFWEAGMVGQVLYLDAEAAGLRATGIGCFFDDPTHEVFGLHGRAFQSLYHFTVGGAVDDPRLTTLPPYSQARRALEGFQPAHYNDPSS